MWPALLAVALAAAGAGEAHFRPVTAGPLVSYTAHLTPRGHLLVQPLVSAGALRGAFDTDWAFAALDPGNLAFNSSLTIFVEAGLHEQLTVGAQGAVVANHRREGTQSATFVGAADTLLFTRAQFLSELRADPLTAAFCLQVKLPSGNAVGRPTALGADLVGTGVTDVLVGLNLTRHLWPVVLHLDLFAVGAVGRVAGDGLAWSLALELPLFDQRLALLVEVSARHLVGDVEAPPADELVVGLGLEWIPSASVQVLVGYQRTVAGRSVPAIDALTLTVVPDLELWR